LSDNQPRHGQDQHDDERSHRHGFTIPEIR
jgi:hypothetical protein